MTWIYILIAVLIVGLIIWTVAKKKKGGPGESESPGPSEPPSTPPPTMPGM